MKYIYKILGIIFFTPAIYYIYSILKDYLSTADSTSSLEILFSPTYVPSSTIIGVYTPLILGLLLAFTGSIFLLRGFNKLPLPQENDFRKIFGGITLCFGGITSFFIFLLIISKFEDYWAAAFALLSMTPLSLSLTAWLIVTVKSYRNKTLMYSLWILLILIVCYLGYIHSINVPSSIKDCESDNIYKKERCITKFTDGQSMRE